MGIPGIPGLSGVDGHRVCWKLIDCSLLHNEYRVKKVMKEKMDYRVHEDHKYDCNNPAVCNNWFV